MSWSLRRLDSICEKVSVGHVGTTSEYYTDNAGVPFLRTQNVNSEGIVLNDVKYITQEFHSKLKKSTLSAGDVILSRVISKSINCGIVPETLDGANCANIILASPKKDTLDSRYLMYYLRSDDAQRNLLTRQVGSAQSVINTGVLKSWEIPLPPLPEQKRIAVILDKADAIRRKRQQAIQLADEFLRSVFLDMFGDPVTNSKGFNRCRLGDQITLQRGKDITKKEAIPGEVPVISSGGVSFFHNEPLITAPGVLLGRKGSVGKVHYTDVDFWPHDTTLYIKNFKGNIPRFVYHFFLKFPISHYEASAANPSLNRNNLHPVEVFWPPIDLQQRFATIVDSIEQQKVHLRDHLAELDTLFASLQQRAFKGEL